MLWRKMLALGGAAAAMVPSLAHAGTCEDTFEKRGSAVSGLRYVAMTSVADLPIEVAINQMRGIAARRGYDIIATEAAAGALLIEQPMTGKARAFPIEVTATQTGGVGTVRMEAKLRAGVVAPAEGAKTEMCAALAELKGGKAGRAAALSGAKAVTTQAAPASISAQSLSQQIAKDIERNPLAVKARYVNKRYTLSGTVERVAMDGKDTRVWFEILEPHELVLKLPNAPKFHMEVGCALGAGQSVFAMQLKPKRSVKLTGTYDGHDDSRKVVWLKDCAPVK